MAFNASLARNAAVWLMVGLIGGGIAADQWDRRRAARDLEQVNGQHADQLDSARATIEQLKKDLDAERQRRERLEGVVADLRKGS